MSKAVLEIPTPESCSKCKLKYISDANCDAKEATYCVIGSIFVSDYTSSRHPDCQLVIEEKGLRWLDMGDGNGNYYCPKCPCINGHWAYRHCPICGVRLDPPLEDEKC